MPSSSSQIVLLTGSHLCNNPRVVKEADALARAGYDVEVLGWNSSSAHAEEDRTLLASRPWRFTACVDLLDPSPLARAQRLQWQVRRKGAWSLARRLGRPNIGQLGGWRHAIYRVARTRRASLFIAHSAVTMWVARQLQRDGASIGVDMEDWFSREHPAPGAGPVIAGLEQELLRQCRHATCPSAAMSDALAQTYGCAEPRVVYNAFPWAERDLLDGKALDRKDPARLSLHWYSQTLGAGRGLEELFAALPLLRQPIEVHLRGAPVAGVDGWLAEHLTTEWRERVHVHAPVPNRELLSRIAEHDVGFAGETSASARALTVTNKILHYLLGGLAVIAGDTPGQLEVAAQAPDAVALYPVGNPRGIAEQIDRWSSSVAALRSAKAAALESARRHFCWEKVEPSLLDSIASAIGRPTPSP